MKKILAILVIVFLLLISMLTGCSAEIDTSPEYNPETDYNLSYSFLGDSSHMVETEEGYYYVTQDHYLRFIDKITMVDVPLCGKPECSHGEAERETCSAYLGAFSQQQIFYYHHEIYCFVYDEKQSSLGFDNVYLSRISKDGSTRKKIWEIQWGSHPGYFQYGVLHRGVYYFYISYEDDMAIYAYDLKKDRCKEIYSADRFGSNLTPIGNHIYWRHLNPNTLESQMMQYEISTGEIKEILGPWKVIVYGNNLLFEEYRKETKQRIFYTGDRESADLKKVGFSADGILSGDQKYLYSFPEKKGDDCIEVYDAVTREEIASLNVKDQIELLGAYRLIPGSGEKIFLVDIQGRPIVYAYKSAIGTPDFQWYEVEKVN